MSTVIGENSAVCEFKVHFTSIRHFIHARIQRGTGGPDPHPPEKLQKYMVSKQYWSGSPANHKAFKPAFIVGTPAKRHLNGDSLVGRKWPAYSSDIWILSSPLIK